MLDDPLTRNSSHSSFRFRCFPELQTRRWILALLFFLCFLSVLLGNSALVYVTRRVARLRSPMYVLVCLLCAVDVLQASAILPNMLLNLLLDWSRISLTGCLIQMFSTYFLSSLESTLLLVMALDRYVAICKPLRYADIMSSSAFLKLLVFALLRSVSIMSVLVVLAGSLWFCGSDAIQHCYCDHMALVRLACGRTQRNRAAGLAVIVCFVGVDIPVICFSYLKIVKVAVRAAAGEERLKALHTCSTHLMVIVCFYLVGTITFLSGTLNIPIPTGINTLMGVAYILIPATVNPIIYGVRTKEIRRGLQSMFRPPKLYSGKTLTTSG
ncbi:olfactory receptor 52K2 [Poeciliopsis prolifica]|uniref:olfactory receptor 52K2 n=1 Tax=Poeciliopsis prolifica TaxID=188132 RepID=UPI0024139A42|nr:olfactory receptor 52K2 [Poeciliopsis prolifica]